MTPSKVPLGTNPNPSTAFSHVLYAFLGGSKWGWIPNANPACDPAPCPSSMYLPSTSLRWLFPVLLSNPTQHPGPPLLQSADYLPSHSTENIEAARTLHLPAAHSVSCPDARLFICPARFKPNILPCVLDPIALFHPQTLLLLSLPSLTCHQYGRNNDAPPLKVSMS